MPDKKRGVLQDKTGRVFVDMDELERQKEKEEKMRKLREREAAQKAELEREIAEAEAAMEKVRSANMEEQQLQQRQSPPQTTTTATSTAGNVLGGVQAGLAAAFGGGVGGGATTEQPDARTFPAAPPSNDNGIGASPPSGGQSRPARWWRYAVPTAGHATGCRIRRVLRTSTTRRTG